MHLDRIASLWAEAARLSQSASERAAAGDLAGAEILETRADELRAQARAAVQRKRQPQRIDPPEAPSSGTERAVAVRQVILDALNELGVASSPRAVADYARARFGVEVDYKALTSLRRDEHRAWKSPRTHRPTYAVPALEGHHFLAMRGKLALSDWPLEQRLVGPWSERADHLRATVNLARQLGWVAVARPEGARRLADLVATYSATVPSALEPGAEPVPEQVERAAREELEVLGGKDLKWRAEAAARARRILSEEEQVWGAHLPELVREVAD